MALMATLLPDPVDPAMSRCGMLSQIGGNDAAVDVLAHGQRELRFRSDKLLRLHDFAQPDGFALAIGNLNADRGFAGHAFDQYAFRAHGQAEVVREPGYTAVLDARLRLELEGGHHRAGIDLADGAVHVKLRAFLGQHLRQVLAAPPH